MISTSPAAGNSAQTNNNYGPFNIEVDPEENNSPSRDMRNRPSLTLFTRRCFFSLGCGVSVGCAVYGLLKIQNSCSTPELPCRGAVNLRNLSIAIEGCDPCATELIKESYIRVSSNLDQILNQDKIKVNATNRAILEDYFDRKAGYATYICHNNCSEIVSERSLAFVKRADHKNTTYLCMTNIQNSICSSSELPCQLDGIFAHEAGHIADVEKYSNHNDGPNGDPVYQLEWASEQVCRENLSNDAHLLV